MAEIVPVRVTQNASTSASPGTQAVPLFPRRVQRPTESARLAKLKPAVGRTTVSSPRQSSHLSEGASVAFLMDARRLRKPGASRRSVCSAALAVAGCEHDEMGHRSGVRRAPAVKRHGLTVDDIGLWSSTKPSRCGPSIAATACAIPDEPLNVTAGDAIGLSLRAERSRLVGHALIEGPAARRGSNAS